jgi:hypothetical protein
MKPCSRAVALAFVAAGWASGAAAQEECAERIGTMKTIGDVQAVLSCMDKRIATQSERTAKENDARSNQALQQITNTLEVVTTNARNVPLKEATAGVWKAVPESDGANACYVSSVRLPPQGLCQVTYQSALERWGYNISDPAAPGFLCTATCVWLKVLRKPQPAKE